MFSICGCHISCICSLKIVKELKQLKQYARHIILLLALLFSSYVLLAQQGNLYQQINDANRIMTQEPEQALSLIQSALKESFRQKDRRGEGFCYNSLGALNYQLGKYDLAIENYQKAIDIFVKVEEEVGLYNSEKYLAIAFEGKGDLAKALAQYEKLLAKIQAQQKVDDEIDIRRRMARIYQLQKQGGKAQFQFQCISGLEENRGNSEGYINNLNNWGFNYIEQQDTTQAINSYESAIELSEQNGYAVQTQQSYENLSNVYRGNRNVKKELATRSAANVSYKKTRNKKGEASNNLEIGKLLLEEGDADKAIPYFKASIDLNKELGEVAAEEELNQAIASRNQANNGLYTDEAPVDSAIITDKEGKKRPVILPSAYNSVDNSTYKWNGPLEINDTIPAVALNANTVKEAQTQLQVEAYESLALAYEQKGELDEALASFKQAASLADSLAKLRDLALREALSMNSTLAVREEELLRMQQDQALNDAALRQQQAISLLLLIGFIALLIAGFFILRNRRAKQRAHKLLALRSLRSQMNPHFIFNSLNSINSFISKNDERSANKYLSNFSRLMRTVLEHSSHDFVPLTSELQVLELYLSLEHFRFADKFEYTFEVDPNIQTDQIEIPPMLIQPYIENAIWHGLRYKNELGKLRVAFRQDGDRLIGIVEDDGIGRTRSQALKTKNQKSHTSTGLKNTEQRVELINSLYGKGVSVSIADLDEDCEDCGTRVEIVIPYQEAT